MDKIKSKCGALFISGNQCSRTEVYQNGRCRFHGGLSTGPKSAQGKARAAENGKLGGRPRKRKSLNPLANHLANPQFNVWQNADESVAKRMAKPVANRRETLMFHYGKNEQQETEVVKTKVVVNPKVSPRVRCCNCQNFSAGYTCLAPASGQDMPEMGELRACYWYVPM